jgi:hypothetical protein
MAKLGVFRKNQHDKEWHYVQYLTLIKADFPLPTQGCTRRHRSSPFLGSLMSVITSSSELRLCLVIASIY